MSSVDEEMQAELKRLAAELADKSYVVKVTELPAYQALRGQSPAYRGRVAMAVAEAMWEFARQESYQERYTFGEVLTALMRGTLQLTQDDYLRLFRLYGLDFDRTDHEARRMAFWGYPLGLTLSQVARMAKKDELQDAMRAFLQQFVRYAEEHAANSKIIVQARELLQQGNDAALPVVSFPANDALGVVLNGFVTRLSATDAHVRAWLQLLQLCQKASGGQPSAKFSKEVAAAVADIGADAVLQQMRQWLKLLTELPVEVREQSYQYSNGTTYDYNEYHFLHEPSVVVAKGLVWATATLADDALQQQLADLATKCHRKIPGKGPLAVGLGNACLLALAQGGLSGVAHLSRLRLKVRQSNTQELIGRYIERGAAALGVTPAEIEDMAVPTAGLTHGRAVRRFGDYCATLELVDGKAELRWEKAGKALKSAPAALKKTHVEELKELKADQTQAQQTYTAQRDRLDRSFVEGRRMPYSWFRRYYLEHGLLNQLVERLVWRFHQPDGTHHDALWLDGAWHDAREQSVPTPSDDVPVQLWHPVLSAADEVLAWRGLLEKRQLRQPLKQAFREVYLLTPPEERTRTYSNRMAAHILKQHQFNSLAKLRGWKYSLLGAYDKGYESDKAQLNLPAHDLRAEFWVSEVNADDAWNDTGIWYYVSTDQLRFTRLVGEEALPLTDIAPLVFSEVMRDVDLFVGVASVGNDPLWRDGGGLVQYRNYWENYSFGELSEVAKTRKLALQRLVPRLRIANVTEVQDKFLVVKGKLRTYKIHMGSGNILMEPNDQYLCIVPDSSKRATAPNDVFLPFEGDAILSIIISKALLLADDDKITDSTITRQIGR